MDLAEELEAEAPLLTQLPTESALEARSHEWENKQGQHITQTDFVDSKDSDMAKSYLQYVLSGFGTIDVAKLSAVMPYILDASYNKAREHFKNLLFHLGFVEASPVNQQRVAEALKNTGYNRDVIVIENPALKPDYAACVTSFSPFELIILTSKNFNDEKYDEFSLYHELGHLYHQHPSRVRMHVGAALEAILYLCLTSSNIQNIFGTLPSRTEALVNLASYMSSLNLIVSVSPPYQRLDEREADLYACNELIKQGKIDKIYAEIFTIRDLPADGGGIQEYLAYLTETHPSTVEKAKYLFECLYIHGVGGAYLKSCTNCIREEKMLNCQCKNELGDQVNASIKIPCSGTIENEKGKLVCKVA